MSLILAVVSVAVAATTSNDASSGGATKAKSKDGTLENRLRLYNDLFKNYNTDVHPESPVDVKLGVALLDVDVNEEDNTLDSDLWLRYVWTDNRLTWDEKEYGISIMRISPQTVWRPDITLYNSAALNGDSKPCLDTHVLVYPSGMVLWVPPCHHRSFCKMSTSDGKVKDEQTCFLKFGSWTFDGTVVDLHLYEDKTAIDLQDYYNVSSWEVASTAAERHVKYYPCCPDEPYMDVMFNMTLKRKSEGLNFL